MQHISQLDISGLSGRFKRLSDLIARQSDEFYKSQGIKLSSRCFPLFQLLDEHETLSVTKIAENLGQTHPAVSQMTKKLESENWLYHEMDAADERRRLIALTPQGYEILDQLKPLWDKLQKALNQVVDTSGYGLIENLQLLERELSRSSLKERVETYEREHRSNLVEIIHYEPVFAKDFYRLNRRWLDKYFYVEAIDHEILTQPETHIINKGGFILLARLDNKIIGTAALMPNELNQLELSKMAVDEEYQGLGIGEKIARAAINQYRATDYSLLYLESNRQLSAALNLYRKLGFIEKISPFESSHYNRADIYMEFKETE